MCIAPSEAENTWYGRQQNFVKNYLVSLYIVFNLDCVIQNTKVEDVGVSLGLSPTLFSFKNTEPEQLGWKR